MLRPACCAIALSFLLAGCGEATDPVHRSGTLVNERSMLGKTSCI